jgi:caffeoyl-CoA O-methyltransferase
MDFVDNSRTNVKKYSMTISSSFDLQKALDYISTLLTIPDQLEIIEQIADGIHIQPTVGPLAAVLLDVLVRSTQPQAVLEIGTSLGYSACVLGKAVQGYGGKVTTIEIDESIAQIAKRNLQAANLEHTVEVIIGDAKKAIESLAKPYGLILQDGDKDDYLPMLDRLVELLEPGGMLVSDDVLFPVMDLSGTAKRWQESIEAYNQALRSHPDLNTVWLPIGDGISVSVKTERT